MLSVAVEVHFLESWVNCVSCTMSDWWHIRRAVSGGGGSSSWHYLQIILNKTYWKLWKIIAVTPRIKLLQRLHDNNNTFYFDLNNSTSILYLRKDRAFCWHFLYGTWEEMCDLILACAFLLPECHNCLQWVPLLLLKQIWFLNNHFILLLDPNLSRRRQ